MKAWWLAVIITSTAVGVEADISWITSYDEGLAAAKTSNQPVLIDFYATWCGWCRVMDREVYSNPRVIELLRNYICVKVDVDQNPKIALKHQISSLPRTIVLDGQGAAAGDLLGYVEAGQFIAFLTGIRSNELALAEVNVDGPPERLIEFLAHPDPRVRAKASAVLVTAGRSSMPALAKALSSSHLGSRLAAWSALRRITGVEIEFDPWAPKPEREQAAKKFRATYGLGN